MRQVAQIGPPTSVNRYLLPDERSVITVRMHPAALAGPLGQFWRPILPPVHPYPRFQEQGCR